jgi:hypothetical protein
LPVASSWCSPPLFLGARRPGPRNAHGRRRHRAHSTGPGAGRSVAGPRRPGEIRRRWRPRHRPAWPPVPPTAAGAVRQPGRKAVAEPPAQAPGPWRQGIRWRRRPRRLTQGRPARGRLGGQRFGDIVLKAGGRRAGTNRSYSRVLQSTCTRYEQ